MSAYHTSSLAQYQLRSDNIKSNWPRIPSLLLQFLQVRLTQPCPHYSRNFSSQPFEHHASKHGVTRIYPQRSPCGLRCADRCSNLYAFHRNALH